MTKITVITGGTDGIGKEVALRLAQRGDALILVGRNTTKGEQTIAWLRQQMPNATVEFWQYDLSLMSNVQQLAQRLNENYTALDTLVHCAGVMLRQHTVTAEGLETVFAVQYLSRYLLTYRVMPLLQACGGRVVNVSAGGSINMTLDFDNLNGEKHYNGVIALMHESIANDLLVVDLMEQFADVRCYGYGPGYVRTDLLRDMPSLLRFFAQTFGRFISISPQYAAHEIVQLVVDNPPSGLHGRLFGRRLRYRPVTGFRADAHQRKRLREISDELIQRALTAMPQPVSL